MCTNHSSFYVLWSSVSSLVIFVYYYWLVTGSISPKIIENENKLLYMSFSSIVMCQPGKTLFLKRKRSWHIIVAFTPAVPDITRWTFLGDWKPILMWHSEKSPLVLYKWFKVTKISPETLSGKPLEDFSFLKKAVFVLILQIVDLKSNKG